MNRPLSSTTLRQGKRVYGFGSTESPNYKGATAVRPEEALKGTILRKITPQLKAEPKMLKKAIGRRLKK